MNHKKASLGMMLVTMGIVYGDIGTSPMYVMKAIIQENGGLSTVSEELIIGALSLLIWTITLLTTIKYVATAMRADNRGEGGIFALFSLVKNEGKWLIIPAMMGGAALLADGVLTPAVTVTTAVEGLRSIAIFNKLLGESQSAVVIITLIIISVLFAIQHEGTSKIGKTFGPAMLIWFSFLAVFGIMNIAGLPAVLKAFNPIYAVKILLSPCNKAGFMILGSVFLVTTGAEALYSDMGHVGRANINCSWPFVKVCLILNYLGQGAWIINNAGNSSLYGVEDLNPFFLMLPQGVRPFAVIIGACAAIIASQALITGSYTLVSEAIHLDLFPHLEIRYPSDTKGQLYIPAVNNVLWIGCALVILYFRSGAKMEAAYGLAITIAMLMTTLLLSEFMRKKEKKQLLGWGILVVFGAIEAVFFVSSLGKFTRGGYVSVILTAILLYIMIVWFRGTKLERRYTAKLNITDYKDQLVKLHADESIPLVAHNLVYLNPSDGVEIIDRDILYSIMDKDTKRAAAYWFVSVNVIDEPDAMRYKVETFGTDCIFKVKIELGFRCHQKVNVYLRQIVSDLQKSGELPNQHKPYSIYKDTSVGTFKFCMIFKSVPTKSELSNLDELMLNSKYFIRKLAGSRAKWYGLDTSNVISEYVPLIPAGSRETSRIIRCSEE